MLAGRTVILCKNTWSGQFPVGILLDQLNAADDRPHMAVQRFLAGTETRAVPINSGLRLHTRGAPFLQLLIPQEAPAEILPPQPGDSIGRLITRYEPFRGQATMLTVLLPSSDESPAVLEQQPKGTRHWRLKLQGTESLILAVPKAIDRTQASRESGKQDFFTNGELALLQLNGAAVKGLLLHKGSRIRTGADLAFRAELSIPGSVMVWMDKRGEMTAQLIECVEPMAGLTIVLGHGPDERRATVSLDLGERIRFRPF
jgi:hypothetical protein